MEELVFKPEDISLMFNEAALMIMIPVAVLIFWRKKTHSKLLPAAVGAAVFIIFALLLKAIPAYFLTAADNPAANAIRSNIWLYYLTAGILAGIFEEGGRFLAFRTVLKKYTGRNDGITYGIGHGGFECIYIGIATASMAVTALMINGGNAPALTAGMDEASIRAMAQQLSSYSDLAVTNCLLGVLERIGAIVLQISLSVLVFTAVREKKHTGLFPLAVLIHTFVDFSVVFNSAGIVSVIVFEIVFLAEVCLTAYFAYRIYLNSAVSE